MANERLRSLPSIERLLARPTATRLVEQLGRDRVRDLLRDLLDELRREMSEVRGQKSEVSSQRSAVSSLSAAHSDLRPLTSDLLLEEIERRLEARGGVA